MIEEFITYKGCIYKKIGELGCIIKQCPNCNRQFFTKEQRKKYCCNACKTEYWRKKHKNAPSESPVRGL